MASSEAASVTTHVPVKECDGKQAAINCRDVVSSEASAASSRVVEEAREGEQTAMHDNFVTIYEEIEALYWDYDDDHKLPAHVEELECSLWARRSELLRELVKCRTPPKLNCECVYCTKYGLDFVLPEGM